MDLGYENVLFHGYTEATKSRGPDSKTSKRSQQQNGHLAGQPAASRGGLFGSVASQAAYLVSHPGDVLHAAYSCFRGEKPDKLAARVNLLQQLRNATSWSQYSALCIELDDIEGGQVWKYEDLSELYDVDCLLGRLKRLNTARNNADMNEMITLLRSELTRDLGGMSNQALHQHTRSGTKFLIGDYIKTVGEVLDYVVKSCADGSKRLRKIEIQTELEETRRSYGRTALLLSGGGTLGMAHIGVIKALHEAGALPRIISGSSSGSIVASVLGSTPDDELLTKLYDFCQGDLAVFVGAHEKQGWGGRVKHFGQNGYLFDLGNLRRVMVDLLDKTTFSEAYNRTRRILNITVSNSADFESQQVLNYATAGNVVIWSAVVASCAVPFGFEPERLLCKRDGDSNDLYPWDPVTRYVDGSINGDLPTDILSAEFDVNHSIVSQVNPHVVPFLKPSKGTQPQRVSPYWTTAASLAKEEAIRSVEILSELPFLERNNNVMSKLNSVLGQRYSGDITLFPVDTMARFWTILENPSLGSMEEAALRGERATWPVLDMIKTHMDIELLIDNALRKVSEYVSFGQSTSDLRRLQLKLNQLPNHGSGGRLRNRRAARGRKGSNEQSERQKTPIRVRLAPSDLQQGPLLAVNGEATPPESSAASSAAVSDNETDDDGGLVMRRSSRYGQRPLSVSSLAIQSQPNTPTFENSGFFDSSRSTSPAPAPASLTMTPVTPRARSPEMSFKGRNTRHKGQRKSTSKSPPPKALSLSDEPIERSWSAKLFNPRMSKRVKSAVGVTNRGDIPVRKRA